MPALKAYQRLVNMPSIHTDSIISNNSSSSNNNWRSLLLSTSSNSSSSSLSSRSPLSSSSLPSSTLSSYSTLSAYKSHLSYDTNATSSSSSSPFSSAFTYSSPLSTSTMLYSTSKKPPVTSSLYSSSSLSSALPTSSIYHRSPGNNHRTYSGSPSVTLTRYNSRRSSLDPSSDDNDSLSSYTISDTSSGYYSYSPISGRRKYYLKGNESSNQAPSDTCGLTNLGNTCYMNSVLQALFTTKVIRNYITRQQRSPLMQSLGTLFSDMENADNTSLSPTNFRTQFIKYEPRFRGYEQHDAQEFLRYLITGLHDEVNEAKQRPRTRIINSPKTSSEAWQQYKTIDDSRFIDILAGQLSSTVTCTICRNTSTCWDPFWDLSLPLPRLSSECTVEQCLEEFTALEELGTEEMPVCERCKRQTPSTKKLSIEKAPTVLILHLKRFSNEGYKLTIPKVIPNENIYVRSRCYNLYAVVCHQGNSSRSGHYTAYCLHSNKWFLFNDERITEKGNFSSTDIQDAYILFYIENNVYSSRL